MSRKPLLTGASLLLAAGLLAGCSSSNDDPETFASYRVTVYNLSANQPLSPIAVALHDESFRGWSLSSAASNALEVLAEGGNNSDFLAQLSSANAVTASGSGAIPPGGSATLEITADGDGQNYLTVASMLVNTNDAFSGVTAWKVSDLAASVSRSSNARIYDAGTEANSETAASIPGPAGGGEGYNAARDDRLDAVHVHPGVVSADDGLSSSALNESHRFDNPGLRISVTRL